MNPQRRIEIQTLHNLLLKYPDGLLTHVRKSGITDVSMDRSWNIEALSRNPSLPIEYVESHPELPWNWESIFINCYLNDNFEKYAQMADKNYVRPYWMISDEDEEKGEFNNSDEDSNEEESGFNDENADWTALSCNPYLMEDLISEYEDKWSWDLISWHYPLTLDFIRKYENRFSNPHLTCWFEMSGCRYLNWEIIQEYGYKMKMKYICTNKYLDEESLQGIRDLFKNKNHTHPNMEVTEEMLHEIPSRKLRSNHEDINLTASYDYIMAHPEIKWDPVKLSERTYLPS